MTELHRHEDLLSYAQGFFEEPERLEFEAHLATCAECQAGLVKVRAFLPKLQSALAPPRLTDAQLLANVRAAHAALHARRVKMLWFWGVLGVAAIALLTLVLLPPKPPPTSGPAPYNDPSMTASPHH